jgi:hypothetical protein
MAQHIPSWVFEKGYFGGRKPGFNKSEFLRTLVAAYCAGDLVWAKQPGWGIDKVEFIRQPDGRFRSEDGTMMSIEQMDSIRQRTFLKETVIS